MREQVRRIDNNSMYITKDRTGSPFRWSKKGKNRECEVRDNKCIVRKCFKPEDCGTVDPKTQQKNIVGKCKTMHQNGCPKDYDNPENYVTYKERNNRRNERRY